MMKAKWGAFLLSYSLFYAWLNISWVLPVTWLQYQRGLFWNLRDYLLWILPALLPYLLLLKLYRSLKLLCIPLVLISIVAAHWLRSWLVYDNALNWQGYFSKNAHLVFSISFFGIVWYFIQAAQYYELHKKDLLTKIRSAELLFLRGQVNPHFLFNSLNNCYGLVYEQSPKAVQAVQSLSKLMEYSYQDFTSAIPVQEELNYIREYVAMQQLRYEPAVAVRWETRGALGDIKIHPLLLIPFVENAFKHGDIREGGLHLHCAADGQTLTFCCFNKKRAARKDKTPGVGLANVRRRLQLLYPEKHRLQIADNEKEFEVNLTIDA